MSATGPRQPPPLRLWRGETVHVRYKPMRRRFRYAITLIDLDLDRLAEANRQSVLMGVERPGLFSFRARNHGDRDGTDLRAWAEQQLQAAGVETDGGTIRLASFPRHLFYRFAPISLWLSRDRDGRLNGVIYEVNNTFGESHSYASRIDGYSLARHEAEKVFHVSPFMDIEGRYRFTLAVGPESLELVIDNLTENGRTHTATISASAVPASTGAFARLALLSPFSSLGVTFGIHYQALKVWLGGVAYRRKPKPPRRGVSIAHPVEPRQKTRQANS